MRNTLSLAFVLCAFLASSAAAQTPDPAGQSGYALGAGLPLGSSGVRLGGYGTTHFENATDERATWHFDELSLFVYGDIGTRVRFFVEAEEEHFLQIDSTGATFTNNAELERLYVEYLHGISFKVRAGKFLTPVGTWNEIHPDPLTWTVSRPVASYATFPAFTSGVQAFGTWATSKREVDYNLFVQHNEAIDNSTGDRRTERMIGGRVRVRQGALEIGVPLVRYTERDTLDVVTFSGADLVAHMGRLEIRGEATAGRVRSPDDATRAEYAAYLQGVITVTDRFFIVARQEGGHSREEETYKATSVGLLFHPVTAMSLKVEVQGRSGQFLPAETSTGSRVLASFGVVF